MNKPATQIVLEMVDEWTALRQGITELANGHPRHICWACGIRPRAHTVPGIPVGWCNVCDAQMKADAANEATA